MSKVHFVGGEKGGVGKSVLARLLAQYWIDRDRAWCGFDTDRSHGALLRYYEGFAHPIDVHQVEALDRIVEAALAEPRSVLVDLAAQTDHALHQWLESGGVLELGREAGVEVVFWHVLDDGKDSVRLLERLLDRLGGSARVVVVLNEGRGVDFSLYESSTVAQRVEGAGIDVIRLPALHGPTMRSIDRLDKSFWAAIHHTGDHALSVMDRQRVKVWLNAAYGRFEQLGF